MKKISLLTIILTIITFVSCERDDICPESTPTTPNLIIDVFDFNNQESKKNVFGLFVIGVDNENVLPGYAIVSSNNLVLPLKTDDNRTQYILIKDSTINDNGTPDDTSDDFIDGNQDIITINYSTELVYVSRACGYKTIFKNVTVQVEDDTDNWVQSIQPLNSNQSVEDEQKHILTYFISSLILMFVFCVSVNAQNDSIVPQVNDSLKVKQKYGLRVGGDLGKLIRSFVDDDYSGFEITADYRLKKRLYIAGEIGIEEKNTITDYIDITSKGSYIKGGIDYNMYQNWLDMDNMIYTGFRIGASSFSQNINSFTVYSTNQYWASQFSSDELQEFKDLTAFWAELILGLKAELFNNLYLGLNVQLKILASETEPDNFGNVYIPGFNKTFDSSGIGVGYSYTISYRIPLYKKDK